MSELSFYNTPRRKVETFTPLSGKTVRIYTCGPTVYNELHVGNWAAYVRWDLLIRTLLNAGYEVDRVMNITDVGHLVTDADEGEDKIQKGAHSEGVTAWEIADKYSRSFIEGMKELNLLPPQHLSKATEHIEQQIDLIKRLEEKGFTYRTNDGIYFDTAKFPHYAAFARLDLTGQKAGARVEANTDKRNPWDFALWKFSPSDVKRDMEWESPWGKGFPGWHIECSAMALHYLGDTLDIHTGGIDHIPVHHTNEVAQSEAATGKTFSNFWLHSNFLTVNGTKISKSLGNGYTLGDLRDKGFLPMDFRMFALQSHYRTEADFTWEAMTSAKNRLISWLNTANLRFQRSNSDGGVTAEEMEQALTKAEAALYEDLNSPRALAFISEVFNELDDRQFVDKSAFESTLEKIDNLFGLGLIAGTTDINEEDKQLIQERSDARATQDWHRADVIRDELLSRGIALRDTPDGTIWIRTS